MSTEKVINQFKYLVAATLLLPLAVGVLWPAIVELMWPAIVAINLDLLSPRHPLGVLLIGAIAVGARVGVLYLIKLAHLRRAAATPTHAEASSARAASHSQTDGSTEQVAAARWTG